MAIEGIVLLILWPVLLGVKIFALVDCLRRPSEYFPYLNKQTKPLWLGLTSLAVLTGLVPGWTTSIFGIAGIVIALIYLFDIRPKMIEATGRNF